MHCVYVTSNLKRLGASTAVKSKVKSQKSKELYSRLLRHFEWSVYLRRAVLVFLLSTFKTGGLSMVNKTALIVSIISLGLVLGIASGETAAQTSHQTHSVQTNQFQRIDQPLGNKVAVTLGGLGLIGLELWWFLLSKPKS
jgi:hypothetical protein